MARSLHTRLIVEKAPNHDATKPAYSIWTLRDDSPVDLTPPSAEKRPMWSIQVYDTSSEATDPDYLQDVAKRIFQDTWDVRSVEGREKPDRVDIYALPLPADVSDEDRVRRCIAHQKREIHARNSTGRTDFFIQPAYDDSYHRMLLITDRPEGAWDEGEGGFLGVMYDVPFKAWRRGAGQIEPGWCRVRWEELGEDVLRLMRENHGIWFCDSYLGEGIIDDDLRVYASQPDSTYDVSRVRGGTWLGPTGPES